MARKKKRNVGRDASRAALGGAAIIPVASVVANPASASSAISPLVGIGTLGIVNEVAYGIQDAVTPKEMRRRQYEKRQRTKRQAPRVAKAKVRRSRI